MPMTEVLFQAVALADPDGRWELGRGRLREKPAMAAEHNQVRRVLTWDLSRQVDLDQFVVSMITGQLALRDETRAIPDIFVIENARVAGGFLPRLPQTLEELDLLLLMVPTPRRVQRDGIRFAGFCYFDPTLAAHVGETVTVRYDPRDLAEIRVFHRDRFLCRAVRQELVSQTVRLKEIVQARNARRRELRRFVAARISIADQLLAPLPQPIDQEPAAAPRLKRYLNE